MGAGGYGHFGGTFGRYGDANEMNMAASGGSSGGGGGQGLAKAGEWLLEHGEDVGKFLGGLFKKKSSTEAEVVGTDTSVSSTPWTPGVAPRTAVAPDVQQRLLARRVGVDGGAASAGYGSGSGSGSVGPLGISWGVWGLGGLALGAAFLGRKKLKRAFR